LDCATDADLLLILTGWQEIGNCDVDRLKQVMKCPVVVDGRNVFDPARMREKGFEYHAVGRP
jgi:UDPglucose 6-dehydrogenase